jgi:hypothetical protein
MLRLAKGGSVTLRTSMETAAVLYPAQRSLSSNLQSDLWRDALIPEVDRLKHELRHLTPHWGTYVYHAASAWSEARLTHLNVTLRMNADSSRL